MATIIDELVVSLILDAAKVPESQRKIIDSFHKIQQRSDKFSKDTEKGFGGLETALEQLQGRLLGIAALFASGLGVHEFAADISNAAKSLTEAANRAQQIGVSAQTLRAADIAGQRAGASPGEVSQSLEAMRQKWASGTLHGISGLQPYLLAMGITNPAALAARPDAMLQAMHAYAMQHMGTPRETALTSQLFKEMGASPGTIALAMRKDMNQLLKEAKELTLKPADYEKFKKLNDAMADTSAKATKLKQDLEAMIAPKLMEFIHNLGEAIMTLDRWATGKLERKDFKTDEEWKRYQGTQPQPGDDRSKWQKFKDNFNTWRYGVPYYKGKPGTPPGQTAPSESTVPKKMSYQTEQQQPNTATAPLSETVWPVPGKIDRSRFAKELQENPGLQDKILRIAANEQGRNPKGTQAVLESMMNRADARGTTLAAQAHWYDPYAKTGYYEKGNMGRGALEDPRHRAILEQSLKNALSGSNVSNYATDNSSGALAARERASGKFTFQSTYGGESFFSPGWSGTGKASRKTYEQWRKTLRPPVDWSKGTSPVTDWGAVVPHPGLITLAGSGNVSHNNTTSSTSINNLNVYSATDDPQAHAADIRATLRRNQNVTQATGGPN